MLHLPPLVRRVVGWAVIATGVIVVILQVRSMVKKNTGLPDIRHPVYWHHDLYEQALSNKHPAIATQLAPFYLIERAIKGADLIVGKPLAGWQWQLEAVSRTHVKPSTVAEIPLDAWHDLEPRASYTGVLDKRPLYILADPTVKTYVFVSTAGDAGPLYIVPESIYRSRVADKSGANLSAP